jgi:predicted nucleic acid-binding protein
MYLVDTDVISESRKGPRANAGVRAFFRRASQEALPLYVSAVTVGELRRGIARFPRLSPADFADWDHRGSVVGGAVGDDVYWSGRLPASFRALTPR